MRLEVIIPRELLFDPKRLERVVENTLNEEAAAVKYQFETTTDTWTNKPLFVIDKKTGERTIYTADIIYKYVNDGTKPHPIVARNAKALHFYRTGFRPKSRVRYLGSNKGSPATKDETFAKSVFHPGTEGRKFDEEIKEKWDKELPVQMQRAIDAEVR